MYIVRGKKMVFYDDKRIDLFVVYDNSKCEYFIKVLTYREYWNLVFRLCKCFVGVLVVLFIVDCRLFLVKIY